MQFKKGKWKSCMKGGTAPCCEEGQHVLQLTSWKAALREGLGVLGNTKLDKSQQAAFTRRKANDIWDCMRRSGQQFEGSGPSSLLSIGGTTSGVLCPVQNFPEQSRWSYWSKSHGRLSKNCAAWRTKGSGKISAMCTNTLKGGCKRRWSQVLFIGAQ